MPPAGQRLKINLPGEDLKNLQVTYFSSDKFDKDMDPLVLDGPCPSMDDIKDATQRLPTDDSTSTPFSNPPEPLPVSAEDPADVPHKIE